MELAFGILWVILAIICFIQIAKDKNNWYVKLGEICATTFIFIYGCILIYGGIHTLTH